jgi:hypothetical protein
LLSNYDDVFPLAVTFIGKWKLNENEKNLFSKGSDIEDELAMQYLLSTRLLSMFYGLNLATIQCMVKDLFSQREREIIEATIDHLICKLREWGRTISYFFLFVDDAFRVNGKELFNDDKDHFKPAMLDAEYKDCNTAMVITSKDPTATGFGWPQRSIKGVTVPKFLDSSKIVREIWKKTMEDNCYPTQLFDEVEFQLTQLASLINAFPQLIMTVDAAIIQCTSEDLTGETNAKNFITYLVNYAKTHVSSQYSREKRQLAPSVIYPLIFRFAMYFQGSDVKGRQSISESIHE